MSTLEDRTRFEPAEVEPRIVERWLQSGLHHPVPEGTAAETFSIAIPPPNVTGALHMGHALNGSIQDTLIRYQRMRGRPAKWILGTDHAGIATQKQVERALEAEGTSREELGREAFVERVWEWTDRYGGTIVGQLKRLGATVDYDDERFTLDERYVTRGARGVRRPVPQGPDLPRQLPGQLGPGHAVGDQRPRGRGPRGHRHAVPHRLPVGRRRRRGDGGHRAPGDDARRHRRGREPGRRALSPPHRAQTRSSRSSGAGCRSSPTTTSRPTSAPAR